MGSGSGDVESAGKGRKGDEQKRGRSDLFLVSQIGEKRDNLLTRIGDLSMGLAMPLGTKAPVDNLKGWPYEFQTGVR